MQAWEKYVLSLEQSFGRKATDEWIRSLAIQKFDACNLYLEARDAFHAAWIQEHLLPIAKKNFRNSNGHEIKIHLKVRGQTVNEEAPIAPSPIEAGLKFSPNFLLPEHTYELFIPGAKNNIPFRVLCKLTGFNPDKGQGEPPPKETYNPIYLYGPSGCGKTHLLMSAATWLGLRGLNVFYVHADTFTEHVVKAIRNGQMQAFRSSYRHIDVLIIDDVQVFSRKTATQEELFHTFNTLHTAGKQIILSSPVNPRQLEGIEERLISRFEWGITLPLERLTETSDLLQVITSRLQFYGFHLKKDAIDFLLSAFNTPCALSEAIEKLQTECKPVKGAILATEFFLPILQELARHSQESSLTPEKILSLVADAFGIKVDDILSKSQSREIVLPRQLSMYLLRKELKMPYIKIGTVFSRDHSTVMSSIKQITKSIDNQDKDLFYYLNDIQRKLASS